MEVNLNNAKPHTTDSKMLRQTVKEENSKCTKTTTTVAKTEFTISDNDDSAMLASLPKADMKFRKLNETKLLMDNNENSLSVDTLIEILSSNDTNNKLPSTPSSHNNKSESDSAPPHSAPSTLSSPSSSSSSTSSKTGLRGPLVSPGPSPKSTPKKAPSPYHLNGGKPMISDMNKKMKQVSKRQPRAVYQSQISNNSVGIKICIKKSVKAKKPPASTSMPSPNNKTPKKRSRKSKAKTHESDSDDAYVKRRKKSSSVGSNNNNNTKTPSDEPVEQSGWGKSMPKEILFDVSLSLHSEAESSVFKSYFHF